MGKYKVGVLGGCGLEQSNIIKNRTEKEVTTIYGDPSDVLVEGTIEGVPIAYILWHGKTPSVPGKINYRGNIWALKEAGCTHVISIGTCGSLKEEIKPGDFVVLDSFVDFSLRDDQTFRDGRYGSNPNVLCLPTSPAFCVPLSELWGAAADELGYSNHKTVTVITVPGPRFTSKAESKLFQSWGIDVLNFSTVPEVILAKEAGLLYASIQLVACYDSWKEGTQPVTKSFISSQIHQNAQKIEELVKLIVTKIDARDWDNEIDELKRLISEDHSKPCGCPNKK